MEDPILEKAKRALKAIAEDKYARNQIEFRRLEVEYEREQRELLRAETLREGLAEGRADGLADALIQILSLRAVPFTDEQRERIRGCRDRTVLERWLARAIDAESADDLFR